MNSKLYPFIILFILIVISKEALVFNEEILVLFAFFIFIFLVYNFASGSIASELDARSIKIQQEFQYYKDVQENTINRLIAYHNKQKLLSREIEDIFFLAKENIQSILLSYSKLFLNNFYTVIEDKLKKVFINESKFNIVLQNKISNELNTYLISKYSSNKDKKNRNIFLSNAISFLSNLK